MKVVSLFDGISCAQVALSNLGKPITEYYASEVDKNAIKITQHHFPNTIQVGDIKLAGIHNLPINPDLLIGGSPCQDLSIAGNKGGIYGNTRSALFWEYIRILRLIQPRYFLLENVASMPRATKGIISNVLGVDPILINSDEYTAQNRKRYYWTNIPQSSFKRIGRHSMIIRNILWSYYTPHIQMESFFYNGTTTPNKNGFICVGLKPESHKPKGNYFPRERVFHIGGKARALTTSYSQTPWYTADNTLCRKLLAEEAEELQGLPIGYTALKNKKGKILSDNVRFKAIGNGFTVPVIEELLYAI
jgi:site-specific DNA-cytosine methylase